MKGLLFGLHNNYLPGAHHHPNITELHRFVDKDEAVSEPAGLRTGTAAEGFNGCTMLFPLILYTRTVENIASISNLLRLLV